MSTAEPTRERSEKPASKEESGLPEGVPGLATLARRLLVALVVFGALAFLLAMFVRDPLIALGAGFMDRFGLAGMALGITFLDTLPGTVHEPLMVLAFEGGEGFWKIVLVAGAASWFSGVVGWAIGRALRTSPFVQRILERYDVGPFMRHYGGWAVAIAAFTPFPFALTTWGAGATGVKLRVLMLGSLMRFPKEILYFAIYAYGASLAG